MINDVILNKKESIERCVRQIRLYYAAPSDLPFEEDHLRQDAIAANLQRASEQCIDLANHIVRIKKLGIPKENREGFRLLAGAGIITKELANRLESMVGFRNILVHEYQTLDIGIFKDVIQNRLDDLILLSSCILEAD
ncbi:MAG: DUF86 domain-containing protein [Deltaproteobacteria bacterium]|nr:DUF86 domain-containing protein [Deltaproteobacteria bacterium]